MIAFIALIGGFLEALLLAAVFSGIIYPLYRRFQKITGERNSLSSILKLLISMLVIIVPLLFLLGLVAEQALEMTEMVKPWVEKYFDGSSIGTGELPKWLPFADKLASYSEQISAKIAEVAWKTCVIIASSLATLSEGAVGFFLQLFVMLYAMYAFLVNGPTLMYNIVGYVPLK